MILTPILTHSFPFAFSQIFCFARLSFPISEARILVIFSLSTASIGLLPKKGLRGPPLLGGYCILSHLRAAAAGWRHVFGALSWLRDR